MGKSDRWKVRRASERGRTELEWLKSSHSFSFGHYADPKRKGFGPLRVINEDRIAPGKGFAAHPHRNMEILTYVLSGALEHRDSMGNGSVIVPGNMQYMSAGSGVTHSEFNHSSSEEVHLLQIWIAPRQLNRPPRYDERTFSEASRYNQLHLVVSPDGTEDSIAIDQDARVYASSLSAGETLQHQVGAGRLLWLQLTRGTMVCDDLTLEAGDAVFSESDEEPLAMVGGEQTSEFLLFDLPAARLLAS